MDNLLLPLPFTSFQRPASNRIIYDNNSPAWYLPAEPGAVVVMDTLEISRAACQKVHATLDLSTIHSGKVVARVTGSSAKVDAARAALLGAVPVLSHHELPLDPQYACTNGSQLLPQLKAALDTIGKLANVALIVTRSGFDHDLHVYGPHGAVMYVRYKLKVLIDHISGHRIERVAMPLSMQPLLFGPNRAHFLHIFHQTGVNVYTPSLMPDLRGSSDVYANLPQNEMYVVGNAIQVSIATKLIEEIHARTEPLVKDIQISQLACDILSTEMASQVEDIMTEFATFIQLPSPGARSPTVRVLGVTRSSIERSIEQLMQLCGKIGTATLDVHTGDTTKKDLVPANMRNLNQAAITAIAANCDTAIAYRGGSFVLSGTATNLERSVEILAAVDGIKEHQHQICYILELINDLKDFLAGKKFGKLAKIMAATDTYIWFSAFHEHTFHVNVSASSAANANRAMSLLSEEWPAEEWLYIPEPYHKQVIGTGGSRIQLLMRKYNVFIKFGSSGDKIPNAFGPCEINNVLIRCPAKNGFQLRAAAAELVESVNAMSQEHEWVYISIPRNHRRLLISQASNIMRDIEVSTHSVINLPLEESRTTELVPITGCGTAPMTAAQRLKEHLPVDYEFRVALSPRFSAAVGPGSDFALKVVAPLRIAHNVQMQAFDRVQMRNDMSTYSQIVVSVSKDDTEVLSIVDRILTAYLRENHLEIIEKGELASDPIVKANAANTEAPATSGFHAPTNSVFAMDMTPKRSAADAFDGDVSMETFETPVRSMARPTSTGYTSFFFGNSAPMQPQWGTPRQRVRAAPF